MNSNYLMKPFLNISELISKSYKIKLLKAYCYNFHINAIFALKIYINEIGNNEVYKYICKFCYYKYNNYCNIKEKINEDLKKENLNIKCLWRLYYKYYWNEWNKDIIDG